MGMDVDEGTETTCPKQEMRPKMCTVDLSKDGPRLNADRYDVPFEV